MTTPGLFWFPSPPASGGGPPYDGPADLIYETGDSGTYLYISPNKNIAYLVNDTQIIRVDMLTEECTVTSISYPPSSSHGLFTADSAYFFAQSQDGHIYKIDTATNIVTTINTSSGSPASTYRLTPDELSVVYIYGTFLGKLTISTSTFTRTVDMTDVVWIPSWYDISPNSRYFCGFANSPFAWENYNLIKIDLLTMSIYTITLPTYASISTYSGGFFSQDSNYVYHFHGSRNNFYKINMITNALITTVFGNQFGVQSVITPDYAYAYVAYGGGYLKFDLSDDTYIQLPGFYGTDGFFTSDGQYLLTYGNGALLYRVNVLTNVISNITLNGSPSYPLYNHQFISSGTYLMLNGGSSNGMIQKVNMTTDIVTQYFGSYSYPIGSSLDISPDETIILSSSVEAIARGVIATMSKSEILTPGIYNGIGSGFNSTDTLWFAVLNGNLYKIDR